MKEELLDCNISEQELRDWIDDVKTFTRSKSITEAFQQAFSSSQTAIDPTLLSKGWIETSKSNSLPAGFSWERIAKRFGRAVEKLRIEDQELREVLEAQTQLETADATRQLAGIPTTFNIEIYRDSLKQNHEYVDVKALDSTGVYYTQVKAWSVFVPQNVKSCKNYYPHILEIPPAHFDKIYGKEFPYGKEDVDRFKKEYLDQEPTPIMNIIDDLSLKKLVILGNPGSGKTSLLSYLLLKWVNTTDINRRYQEPLPILIRLREYDDWKYEDGKSLISYLDKGSLPYRLNQIELDKWLKDKDSILLLDGLDEIFESSNRSRLLNDIQYFCNQYPKTKVIVTSRVVGYDIKFLTNSGFEHFMLQDLDDKQIKDFLDKWHIEISPEDENKRKRLETALNFPSIKELAGNPLLLTMMAIVNQNQDLARNRIELYDQALWVLLHAWDTERSLEPYPELKNKIGYRKKREILQEIAQFMQSAPKETAGNIISEEKLEQILSENLKGFYAESIPIEPVRNIIDGLRKRNFILCHLGAERYAFIHRTFLEYSCAAAFQKQFRKNLSLDFLKEEVFAKYYKDENWHEVLCLLASMVEKDGHFEAIANYLIDEQTDTSNSHIFLATQCYLEVPNPQKFTSVRDKLVNKLNAIPTETWPERIKTFR
ncbi:MAG: NACHT domain-containing protein [Blastocatellia bacterium]|nr:NACHT domain-containing protein [Blastocatellia bacterium]